MPRLSALSFPLPLLSLSLSLHSIDCKSSLLSCCCCFISYSYNQLLEFSTAFTLIQYILHTSTISPSFLGSFPVRSAPPRPASPAPAMLKYQ
ncbi:hypothetical protein BO71DRAFT_221327 [Aspergillus ellipticus CBS 707.79]|uniref:Secreted protein n=1 Tax=Aspergillus ellipticus CBS 707.79 TaxID=1448320 RepID=A0A319DSA8_9EURO|nr:hypothetical protein BO71DRAFT_221327 [Aspergillus ellipticus CBS 707.79]